VKDYASKEGRWEMICELISKERISTQQQLLRRLEEEGFRVTQATISRDIKLMGLVKKADPEGGYYYGISGKHQKSQGLNEEGQAGNPYLDSVSRITCARNLVVVNCRAGMAQAICAVIDSMKPEDMIGSIAGDDTILLIAGDDDKASRLAGYLNSAIIK
jgi:transcriptional regulator of arginine metabolism